MSDTPLTDSVIAAGEAASVAGGQVGLGGAVATGAALGTAVGTVVPGLGNAVGAAIGTIGGLIVGGISLLARAERIRKSKGPLKVGKNDLKALFTEWESGMLGMPGTVGAELKAAKAAGRSVKLNKAGRNYLKRLAQEGR